MNEAEYFVIAEGNGFFPDGTLVRQYKDNSSQWRTERFDLTAREWLRDAGLSVVFTDHVYCDSISDEDLNQILTRS